MADTTSRRNRRFLTRPAARFRLAFTIWAALALMAFILYERRNGEIYVTTSYLFVAILLAGFAGMLSYFAWLMYVPTLQPRGEDDVPMAKFFAGLATLIPPCVIGVSVLPVGSPVIPWFIGFFLIVGCFALLTPHQEYLFARHTRHPGLLGPRLSWSTLRTRETQMTSIDFGQLDFAPTTLASTYARTMTRLQEPTLVRERRYEPTPTPGYDENEATPVQSERVVPPTRIQPVMERRKPVPQPAQPRPVQRKVEQPPQPKRRVERPVEPPKQRRPKQPSSTVAGLATGAAVAAGAAAPAVNEPTRRKKKNKKQRRRERQAAREIEARDREQVVEIPVVREPKPVEAPAELKPELRDFIDESGARCIDGLVEAVFSAGPERAYAHVAFNPTFDRKPEVVCEIADDSSARLKSPQAFSYGSRLELSRKHNVREREVVLVSIFARAEPV